MKFILARDAALISAPEMELCSDVLTFRIEGRRLELCGRAYELSEEPPRFKRGVIRAKNGVFLVECDDAMICIAARSRA